MKKFLAADNHLAGFPIESILETFVAMGNDGFMIVDTSYRVLYLNDLYKKFHTICTGSSLEKGDFLQILSGNSDLEELTDNLEVAFAGEVVDHRVRCSKPPTHSFEIKIFPLRKKSGKVLGAAVAVAEGKNITEDQLPGNDDLYKTLIQSSTDAFLLVDRDFKLLYVSDSVGDVLGYQANELVNKCGLEITHPDDFDRVNEWFGGVKQQAGKLLSIESRIKNSHGEWVWIESFAKNMLDNNSVNAIVMNFRNIQSKKLADHSLVQSEQRLSLLLNNTEESFIILNSRLRIVAYNRAAQEHSPCFFKDELQSGISILDLIAYNEVEAMIMLFEKVFKGEKAANETTFTGSNKQQYVYRHVYRPLFDKENDIYGVFITSTDITKSKLAEEQVKESEIRFKTIIQESFDVVLITDAETRITYISPSITNVLGYREDDLIGKKGFDFIHPSHQRAAKEKFNEVLVSPNSEKNIDVRMRNVRGEYVWIEVKAKNMFDNRHVEGILISLRDISYRKNAEEIISLSGQRFKGLVQSGADMISILDANGIIQYSSPTVQSIIGVDPASQKHKSVFDYVHPDDYDRVREKFDGLMNTQRQRNYIGPYRFRNDEGTFFWLESTITNLLDDPSIKGIVLNSRDITERKKLTEELAVNTERLETAQKIARLGYFEYNFKTKTQFFSEEFFQIFGLHEGNLQHFNFWELEKIIHPEDRERVKAEVGTAMVQVQDFQTELRLKMNGGDQKVILVIGSAIKDHNGNLEKFSITIQDITDSRMAMLALQTLEGRFKSLFEHSIDGVIISHENGNIISANPAICKMLGYTIEEMHQLNRSAILVMDSPGVIQLLKEKEKGGTFVGEITMVHKDGHLIATEVTSISMKDAEGNVYYSNIIRDITEKKKIEEEQKSLTQELVKNNEDLQQFSFITSHNLRAPVANLISLLNLYDKENPAEEFNRLLIDKFEEATQQLNNTLNDLINVLVIKSNTNIEKEQLSFSNVFNNVKMNIAGLLEENHGTIEADFSEAGIIEYNRIHLESILLNLISNAIRYRSPERPPHIYVRSFKQDRWIIVSISDNGLGIDLKRYGNRLFGLYQRFHQGKEGKGLGLYMVNSQVKATGGKIEVESEPGKGTTFKIYFKS